MHSSRRWETEEDQNGQVLKTLADMHAPAHRINAMEDAVVDPSVLQASLGLTSRISIVVVQISPNASKDTSACY